MRLGVIADTHGLLRPEVFDTFAQVDHIVHAGDLGSLDLLSELEALAPVTAVFGNTDGFDIVVTHGDQLGSPTPEKLNAAFPQAQIIVYGHTHRPLLTIVDVVVTVMNPGSAGPRRFKLAPSVGILELEPGIPPRGRVVPLLDPLSA
jgi:putative phosphoesterase